MTAHIRAFVGLNGGGKTLAAVELCALPALKAGRPVVSNFKIKHDLWVPLRSWRHIPELRNCTLIIDEVTAALPARQSQSLPAELARVLNQLRKVDVEVAWTGPNWARADKMLREVTGSVTVCRGSMPDRWVRDDQGEKLERHSGPWQPNRMFRWTTYAGEDFDEFTFSAQTKLRPVAKRWYWRPKHEAHRLYETLDAVELLDHLDFTSVCPLCDGSRKRHVCKCVHEAAPTAASAAEAPPEDVEAEAVVRALWAS
jgi:Zonular occludens toxin (Zot)